MKRRRLRSCMRESLLLLFAEFLARVYFSHMIIPPIGDGSRANSRMRKQRPLISNCNDASVRRLHQNMQLARRTKIFIFIRLKWCCKNKLWYGNKIEHTLSVVNQIYRETLDYHANKEAPLEGANEKVARSDDAESNLQLRQWTRVTFQNQPQQQTGRKCILKIILRYFFLLFVVRDRENKSSISAFAIFCALNEFRNSKCGKQHTHILMCASGCKHHYTVFPAAGFLLCTHYTHIQGAAAGWKSVMVWVAVQKGNRMCLSRILVAIIYPGMTHFYIHTHTGSRLVLILLSLTL